MSYVVQPLLAEQRSWIVEGLRDGSLTRWGGVIRASRGKVGAGQIAAHLRDLATTQDLSSALAPLLSLTQVAAAASVLNLGVSVVGFAVMNHKLNQLRQDIGRLSAAIDRNHHEILTELDALHGRLVELRYITLHSQSLLEEAIAQIHAIRREHLDTYVAQMLTEVSLLARSDADDRALQEPLRVFREARLWLESGMAADDNRLVDTLIRFRAWCFAVAGETGTLRRLRENEEAVNVAHSAALKARELASGWGQRLLSPQELGGHRRFAHSAFDELAGESRIRLARLAGDPRAEQSNIGPDALTRATEVAARVRAEPANWVPRQLAAARVLDFAEECTERLESLDAEMDFCHQRRLSFDRWERLSNPAGEELAWIAIREAA